jgi:predicted Zn-ribbon and HTH transcriptional regulator
MTGEIIGDGQRGIVEQELRHVTWQRLARRAALVPWNCEQCGRFLMELDPERPSFIRKRCDKCKAYNLWVEGYRTIE